MTDSKSKVGLGRIWRGHSNFPQAPEVESTNPQKVSEYPYSKCRFVYRIFCKSWFPAVNATLFSQALTSSPLKPGSAWRPAFVTLLDNLQWTCCFWWGNGRLQREIARNRATVYTFCEFRLGKMACVDCMQNVNVCSQP